MDSNQSKDLEQAATGSQGDEAKLTLSAHLWQSLKSIVTKPTPPKARTDETELTYLLKENLTLSAHLRQSLKSMITKPDLSKAPQNNDQKKDQIDDQSNDDGFEDFETWVQRRYMKRILYRENKHFVLDIVALQKMCLQFRLKRISKHAFNIITSTPEGTEPLCKMLDTELRNYTAALQDMNYMDRFGLKENVDDPFIITTEKTSQQALLRDVWKEKKLGKPDEDEPKPFSENPQTPNKVKQDIWKLPEYPQHSVPKPLDRSKQFDISQEPNHRFRRETLRRYLEIFTWAFIGNVFLIGPMILMVLRPGLITSLVTTSVCVTIFAAVVPKFLDRIGDVVSATAAYAAVLVVFVGTSGGGSSV